jgi:hypothetical protein
MPDFRLLAWIYSVEVMESLNGLSVCAFADGFHPQRSVWSLCFSLPRTCLPASSGSS